MSLSLFVNRRSRTSLQDQLTAQIGQLIASGTLRSGDRLPSIRNLAARLGIHANTVSAAYKELEERGLVTIRQGSGVKVADKDSGRSSRPEEALHALMVNLVNHAKALGYQETDIRSAFDDAFVPPIISQLVIVNPHIDLQALYLRELSERIRFPMQGMTLEQVAGLDRQGMPRACFLTSTNYAASIQALMGVRDELVVFRLASTEALLARVRGLGEDALIGIISCFPRLRYLMKELLSGVCDEDRLVEMTWQQGEPLPSGLRTVSFVVCDSVLYDHLPDSYRSRSHRFRLLADDVFPILERRLAAWSDRLE